MNYKEELLELLREKNLHELPDDELLMLFDLSTEYDYEQCKEICKRAGLEEEWEEVDSVTFEDVLDEAIEILKSRL